MVVRLADAAVLLTAGAALLAACGGSSGGQVPSVTPSATGSTPVAQPLPQVTSRRPPSGAVDVVRDYWAALGEGDYDAAHALTTGDHLAKASVWASPPAEPEFDSATFLRVDGEASAGGDDATVKFPFLVHLVPATPGPFGSQPVDQLLWARVVRMSDGSWRLVELGTGP